MQPHTLHPINATDVYGNQILGLIYEDLTTLDVDTLEHLPVIAERWEISADNKVFTFYIDPEARWQDGKPVTAEDVKFSFDVLFHEKLKYRAKWMSYYGNVEKAEVVHGASTGSLSRHARACHLWPGVDRHLRPAVPKRCAPPPDHAGAGSSHRP